jgi:hypothetical protein
VCLPFSFHQSSEVHQMLPEKPPGMLSNLQSCESKLVCH